MSATIGAALKKIAVYLLTNPKVLKTIGGIVIGIIIIVVMPIIAVVSVFNGSMNIDTDKLNQSIQENISAEQMENIQLYWSRFLLSGKCAFSFSSHSSLRLSKLGF